MQTLEKEKIARLLDANLNRAQEGLRVCEDICRFILDKKNWTQHYKQIRHRLSAISRQLSFLKATAIRARDIEGDVGKKTFAAELRRKNIKDIFAANSQRTKESLRVLEEFGKLFNGRMATQLKNLRYRVYALEKKILEQCTIVSHPGHGRGGL